MGDDRGCLVMRRVGDVAKSTIQTTGRSGPLLDVRPCPDVRLTETHDRGREVGVPAPPLVDHLRAGDMEPFSDLGRSDEVFHLHNLPGHAAQPIRGLFVCWAVLS